MLVKTWIRVKKSIFDWKKNLNIIIFDIQRNVSIRLFFYCTMCKDTNFNYELHEVDTVFIKSGCGVKTYLKEIRTRLIEDEMLSFASLRKFEKYGLSLASIVFVSSYYHFWRGQCSFKGGVHGSAHLHESKYFFAFARYDPGLFNLIRCLWTIRKGISNLGGNFFHMIALFHMQITVNTSTVE